MEKYDLNVLNYPKELLGEKSGGSSAKTDQTMEEKRVNNERYTTRF
jgi:hypothetical protein